MAENSKIQWTDHTFNPWRGCTKIAPGCANCYADAQSKRNPGTLGIWGPNGTRVVASEAMWREPVKWDRDVETTAEAWPDNRPRVFCASLADVFEQWNGHVLNSRGEVIADCRNCGHCGVVGSTAGAGNHCEKCRSGAITTGTLCGVRRRLVRLWKATPNLDWLVLTKRPENIRVMLDMASDHEKVGTCTQDDMPTPRLENLWLGTSIACQDDADRNIPELLKCRDLAAKLFVSIEPLISPVDLSVPWEGETTLPTIQVDWVIVGGESGPNARPCNVEWIRSIVRQCQAAGVPVFVKQLGSQCCDNDPISRCSWPGMSQFRMADEVCRVLLRDPKGGDHSEWPEDVRVREVPS